MLDFLLTRALCFGFCVNKITTIFYIPIKPLWIWNHLHINLHREELKPRIHPNNLVKPKTGTRRITTHNLLKVLLTIIKQNVLCVTHPDIILLHFFPLVGSTCCTGQFAEHSLVIPAVQVRCYRRRQENVSNGMQSDSDQQLHKIYWRDITQDKLKTHKLTTVVCGTSSAPYLATRCLNKCADNGAAQYLIGSTVVNKKASMSTTCCTSRWTTL